MEKKTPLFDSFGMTSKGRDRKENQDQFLIASLSKQLEIGQTTLSHHQIDEFEQDPPGQLLLVADGLGGNSGGRRASALATREVTAQIAQAMPWLLSTDLPPSEDDAPEAAEELRRAIEKADAKVVESTDGAKLQKEMATTLTFVWLTWPNAFVVHVGDSRCYLLRRGRLRRLTRDHTLRRELEDQGISSVSSAFGDRLVNVVGGRENDASPELQQVVLEAGDLLLLCTDGLTRDLEDDEIQRLLGEGGSAQDHCERLLHAALDVGGADDTTVVVCQSPRSRTGGRSSFSIRGSLRPRFLAAPRVA